MSALKLASLTLFLSSISKENFTLYKAGEANMNAEKRILKYHPFLHQVNNINLYLYLYLYLVGEWRHFRMSSPAHLSIQHKPIHNNLVKYC